MTRCLTEAQREQVLRGIDQVKHQYFTTLSSPAGYRINKHAQDLSARDSLDDEISMRSPAPRTEKQLQPESLTRKTHARSIFRAITDGLKSLGTSRLSELQEFYRATA